jgi:hypothetical protein
MNTYKSSKSISDALNLPEDNIDTSLTEGIDFFPFGRTPTPAWNLGLAHTEETKKKISDSVRGELNGNFGKPMSEETKLKLRKVKLGKSLSPEHIDSLKRARNKPLSQLQIQKISEVHRRKKTCVCGKTVSPQNYGRWHMKCEPIG